MIEVSGTKLFAYLLDQSDATISELQAIMETQMSYYEEEPEDYFEDDDLVGYLHDETNLDEDLITSVLNAQKNLVCNGINLAEEYKDVYNMLKMMHETGLKEIYYYFFADSLDYYYEIQDRMLEDNTEHLDVTSFIKKYMNAYSYILDEKGNWKLKIC